MTSNRGGNFTLRFACLNGVYFVHGSTDLPMHFSVKVEASLFFWNDVIIHVIEGSNDPARKEVVFERVSYA